MLITSVIASDFEEEIDFSTMQPYSAPVRPNENPVLSPLNEGGNEEDDNNNSDDIDVTSILPGFLNNNDLN